MFYVDNNDILGSSLKSNAFKCGNLCSSSKMCTSFVYKINNQNCTLFNILQSSIVLLKIANSTLYIKIV